MKHTYKDAELQSAIDKAMAAEKGDAYLARRPDIATRSWPNEAYLRGTIARAFLAALPEPEPPTVDGKTPGQVYQNMLNKLDPVKYYEWYEISKSLQVEIEAAASAVLAAFGSQPQPAEIPWTEWHGGPCPLKDEEVEEWEYKMRIINHVEHVADPCSAPSAYNWSDGGDDIIAYRVLKWREGFRPVDWKASYEQMSLQAKHHLQLLSDWQTRAEKAEVELARVRKACDRMSEQEVLSLSQLRPITEAGPVPEGCVRVSGYCNSDRCNVGTTLYKSDTHFADIRLPEPAEKPAPETFEAHGKTWTKHTPGDDAPCDGDAIIQCLFADGDVWNAHVPAKGVRWSKRSDVGDIIGWRYADEPTPETLETEPWTPKVGDVVTLKSGGPNMTVGCPTEHDIPSVTCAWFDKETLCSTPIPTACLQPA